MQVSTPRNAGLAAAFAVAALGLMAPDRSEAAAFCQTVASTAARADIDIDDNPGAQFTCRTASSTLNIAQFPGSGSAATDVAPGVLRTATNAMSSDALGEGRFVSTSALVDYRDTITVDGLGADGALLTFKIGVHGLLDATGPDSAGSSFRFLGSLDNRNRVSGTRRDFQACVNDQPRPCATGFDETFSGFGVVSAVVALSAFAFNGDVLDVILFQQSRSLTIIPTFGAAGSTLALFVNTTDWRGLDVTDANRNVILTSGSGFDYRYAALPQGVPEPATWALMILGFGGVGAVLRTRRRVAATA